MATHIPKLQLPLTLHYMSRAQRKIALTLDAGEQLHADMNIGDIGELQLCLDDFRERVLAIFKRVSCSDVSVDERLMEEAYGRLSPEEKRDMDLAAAKPHKAEAPPAPKAAEPPPPEPKAPAEPPPAPKAAEPPPPEPKAPAEPPPAPKAAEPKPEPVSMDEHPLASTLRLSQCFAWVVEHHKPAGIDELREIVYKLADQVPAFERLIARGEAFVEDKLRKAESAL